MFTNDVISFAQLSPKVHLGKSEAHDFAKSVDPDEIAHLEVHILLSWF